MKEQYGNPKKTLEAVALCEEEGSRFPTANFWGSRAITGKIEPGSAEQTIGYDGETIADAMREVGLEPERIPDARREDVECFLELHVEQGPVLEDANLPIAIVDAITGIRHYQIVLKGSQNHAGAFPMDLRQDPMAGFAEIATGVIENARRMGRPAVTTVGRIAADPNLPAVVPGEVSFTIDARHPDPLQRTALYEQHEKLMAEVAARHDLELDWKVTARHDPCPCDPQLVEMLQGAAQSQGIPFLTMPSGAGHDSQQFARIAKIAMIFIRSKGGRSHTEEEFSSIEDIVCGIRVLAAGLHELAY